MVSVIILLEVEIRAHKNGVFSSIMKVLPTSVSNRVISEQLDFLLHGPRML